MWSTRCRTPRLRSRSRRFLLEQLEDRLVLSHTPLTPEVLIAEPESLGIADLAIAADAAGNYVVAWTTDVGERRFNVLAQRYSRDGTPQGEQIVVAELVAAPPIQLSDGTLSGPKQPPGGPSFIPVGIVSVDVAMSADGAFVVVYDAQSTDGQGAQIRADFFAADGTLSDKNIVGQTTRIRFPSPSHPAVALDAQGLAYVTFLVNGPQGTLLGLARLGSDDTPESFLLFGKETPALSTPSIGVTADGNAVVAFVGDNDPSPEVVPAVFAQPLAFDGSALVPTNFVGPANFNTTADVGVARDTGQYVVAWNVNGAVVTQRFDAAGTPQSGPVPVNPGVDTNQVDPHIAVDPDGDFVVGWSNRADTALFARAFNADGTPDGAVLQANEQTQRGGPLDIATDATRDTFVQGWAAGDPSALPNQIVTRIFDQPNPPTDAPPDPEPEPDPTDGGVPATTPTPVTTPLPSSDPATLIALVRGSQRNDELADAVRLLSFRLLAEDTGEQNRLLELEEIVRTPIFFLSSAGEEDPQLGAIAGKVFLDRNGNGLQEEGEPGLSGRDVFVYLDLNSNGQWDPGEPRCDTDVEGRYAFSGLGLMRYNVRQNMRRTGVVQTIPQRNRPYVVELTRQNATINDQNFGTKVLTATPTSVPTETEVDTSQNGDRSPPREEE